MQNKEENRQKMLVMIEDWRGSGLNQQQFCSERGIRYHVFHYWYRRYRSKQKAESFQDSQAQSGFIPVQTLNHSVYFAEIHLSNSNRLILHQSVSVEYLKALIG